MVAEFLELVSKKNTLQKKQMRRLRLSEKEREELEQVLRFFANEYACGVEFLAESYLFVVNMMLEEQHYFMLHDRYRNTSFEAADREIYQNETYMTKYMIGLSLSDYLWKQHLAMLEIFDYTIQMANGGGKTYLEIGPGFGQYLIRALRAGEFQSCMAVDISETSVRKCLAYLRYCGIPKQACEVRKQDFFQFDDARQFDFIVMGEVLEHVEQPLKMLQKIYTLLKADGRAFVTTVMNSPAVDHIYLFRNKQEVLNLVKEAGFAVDDYVCAAAGDMPVEMAQARRLSVNIAMILSKGGETGS